MQVIPDLKVVYLNAYSFSDSDILKFRNDSQLQLITKTLWKLKYYFMKYFKFWSWTFIFQDMAMFHKTFCSGVKFPESKRWISRYNICYPKYNNSPVLAGTAVAAASSLEETSLGKKDPVELSPANTKQKRETCSMTVHICNKSLISC